MRETYQGTPAADSCTCHDGRLCPECIAAAGQRVQRCTTHHRACDCREAAQTAEVERLRAERNMLIAERDGLLIGNELLRNGIRDLTANHGSAIRTCDILRGSLAEMTTAEAAAREEAGQLRAWQIGARADLSAALAQRNAARGALRACWDEAFCAGRFGMVAHHDIAWTNSNAKRASEGAK